MKKILFALTLAALPGLASADNVGQCGWGSKLFDGQKGLVPQVLAVTTNGTSGNQTFGISTGTSGCTQDGVVRSNWKTAMFIDANRTKLARDAAVGEGESLEALAQLIGVEKQDRSRFFSLTRSNFSSIFPSHQVSTEQVVTSLKSALAADAQLEKYSVQL